MRRRMRATALGIRFTLELCILASLAVLAAHLATPVWAKALPGIVFCVTGAAVWGTFLSPRSGNTSSAWPGDSLSKPDSSRALPWS